MKGVLKEFTDGAQMHEDLGSIPTPGAASLGVGTLKTKQKFCWGPMTKACNPIYSGD